jgi:signal transduction histidine kinase
MYTARMDGDCEAPKLDGADLRLMLAIAYGTIAAILLVEVSSMPFGPACLATLACLVGFAALFLIRKTMRLSVPMRIANALAQTVLIVGVMLFGISWMLGGVLFYVLCASIANELPSPLVFAWNGLAFLLVCACSLPKEGRFDWSILPFCFGILAMTALSASLHRAREARAESLRLLGELKDAQGRLRELAVVEERQRLARDIHDAVGYRLTASSMLLESAARFVRTDPDRAVRLVETSRDQVREGLAELRTAVRALREEGAEKLPLAGVLGALVEVFSHSARAEVKLRLEDGLPEPDTDRELVLVRTAQEALTNAQKHSGASRIELSLDFAKGAYELECRDDGRGPARVSGSAEAQNGAGPSYGFGLESLRARAAAFGGSVQLLPAQGGGALLRLWLPAGEEARDGS